MQNMQIIFYFHPSNQYIITRFNNHTQHIISIYKAHNKYTSEFKYVYTLNGCGRDRVALYLIFLR